MVLSLSAACADPDAPSRVGFLSGFYGGAVADEPRAVLVARDVLAAGGSAADAAVALYFALAVTKPAAASLGAVGACLVYEPEEGTVRALDFTPDRTSESTGGLSVAIPGAVRGMSALHAMLGRLRWSRVLGPAEELARFGTTVSRSFVEDLERYPEIAGDPGFGPLVRRDDGGLVAEGDEIVQPELAAYIGAIRAGGAAAFYGGALGQAFADAVDRMGERLDLADMRESAPELTEALVIPAGDANAHFLPSFRSAGPYQALLWRMLATGDRLVGAGTRERPHLLADASARALSAYPGSLSGSADPDWVEGGRVDSLLAGYAPDRRTAPETAAVEFTDSGTSFVVADRSGNAVSCGVTLNRPFGIGRTAPGTGIFPAALPAPGEISGALSPLIVANPNTDVLVLAASAAGLGAPTSVVDVAIRTVLGGSPLEQAIETPRTFFPVDGAVLAETAAGGQALAALGYPTARRGVVGVVNAISCPDGLPDRPESCASAADRRGAGLAAGAVPRRARR